MDLWKVRTEYTFFDGAVSIDELDRLVGGQVRQVRGSSHSVNGQPEKTKLEWEVSSLEAARAALKVLEAIPGLRDVHATPIRLERVLHPVEYQVRASDARAGRAVCVACGRRIVIDDRNYFALEGVGAGNETTLTCSNCGFTMGWIILPEEPPTH
jgi:hypothetical protein